MVLVFAHRICAWRNTFVLSWLGCYPAPVIESKQERLRCLEQLGWQHARPLATCVVGWVEFLKGVSLSCTRKRRTLFLKKILIIHLFIWPCQVLVVAHRIFRCSMWTLRCGLWDLVPWPGIELRSPALGAQNLSHWTTRDILGLHFRTQQTVPLPRL